MVEEKKKIALKNRRRTMIMMDKLEIFLKHDDFFLEQM